MSIFQKIRSWFTPVRPVPDAQAEPPATPTLSAHAKLIARMVAEARRRNVVDALIIDMAHYNGHVREAALKRAAELRSLELLPAIVDRLNDWVPQVRRRAQDLVLNWLPMLDADAAIRLLGTVQHLRVAARADHSAWLQAFEQSTLSLIGADRIVAEVASPNAIIARTCFRLLHEYGLADPATCVRMGLSSGTDIVMARKAAESLVRLSENDRDVLGRLALRSHFGMIRAIALRSLLSGRTDAHKTLAIDMLADPHGWVRLIASTYLERHGVDSAPLFVARLEAPDSSASVLRACLMGLAETGKRDHVGVVKQMTSHPSARVRMNAFAAWLHLAPTEKDDIALRVLADDSRRVRKLVLVMSRKQGAFVPFDVAWASLRERGDVDLMLRYTQDQPWHLLELIVELELASRTDPVLRERLRHELFALTHGSALGYTRPTAAQRAHLAQPDVKVDLLALLGRDGMRAKSLAFVFDNL